jgi:hypothetical protein
MWRCVDLMWIDVSEERIAFIFKVEKSASEEPAWAGGCSLRHIAEDGILHCHRCENLKSYIILINCHYLYKRVWQDDWWTGKNLV